MASEASRMMKSMRRRRCLRAAATCSARACSPETSAGSAASSARARSIAVMQPVSPLGGMKLMPDVHANFREARIGPHCIRIARPSERHVEHLLDAPRTRAHHRDAVAQQDRLVDGMGDEHHGLALVRSLHKGKEFLLQDLARLCIERGEWL